MATKQKTPARRSAARTTAPRPVAPRPAAPRPVEEPYARVGPAAPTTTEERLKQIEALGRQVATYVQAMSKVGKLAGTSAEAKDKAVLAFYERMVVLEGQLSRIQDELNLG